MLTDIQAMIVDYKKKQNYSNLVTNHENEEGQNLPTNPDTFVGENPDLPKLTATTHSNRVYEAQDMQVP